MLGGIVISSRYRPSACVEEYVCQVSLLYNKYKFLKGCPENVKLSKKMKMRKTSLKVWEVGIY